MQTFYIYLTCTAHGKPYWTWASGRGEAQLPDRGVLNPPPVREIGPIETEEDWTIGDVIDLVDLGVDLDDPSTWFDDPNWVQSYLAK